MITPRWVDTRTQPIAIATSCARSPTLAERDDAPAEVQLGGAEVLTYREMMRRAARAVGRRPPASSRSPCSRPRLSSYWVALVTPVEPGLVRPLVDGLGAEMVVDDRRRRRHQRRAAGLRRRRRRRRWVKLLNRRARAPRRERGHRATPRSTP